MPFRLDLVCDGTLFLAYLDPGTGSYVLQILLATLFGGMFALKQSWAELKIWFAVRFGDPVRPTDPISHRSTAQDRTQENVRPGVHGHSTAKIR